MKGSKTSVVHGFVRNQQPSYSTFWFAADTLDSLQTWFEKASSSIPVQGSGDHYGTVTQWLLDPNNGKWIMVFDNANSELDFGTILPRHVPWGKVIFTSNAPEIEMTQVRWRDQMVRIQMQPLSPEESLDLFILHCGNQALSGAQRSEITRLSASLRYNPLAITLASAYFRESQTTSGLDLTYYDSSGNSDDLVQRWALLLLEDASSNEELFLKFSTLLSPGLVEQDIINLCQRACRRLRPLRISDEFLNASSTGSAINHWMSVGILQRQTSPTGSAYMVPNPIKIAIKQMLMNDHSQADNLLGLATLLVTSAQEESSLPITEGVGKTIKKTISCFRNVCLVAKSLSMPLPDSIEKYLQLAALYFLKKTTVDGRLLFKKLF